VRDAQGKVTSLTGARMAGQSSQKDQQPPAIETPLTFDRREVMIKMRDAVHLHTLIFHATQSTEVCDTDQSHALRNRWQ